MVTVDEARRSALEHHVLAWESAWDGERVLLAVLSVASGGAVATVAGWLLTHKPALGAAAVGPVLAVAVVAPLLAWTRGRRHAAWTAIERVLTKNGEA